MPTSKLLVVVLFAAACADKATPDAETLASPATAAPTTAAGPCDEDVARALDRMFANYDAYLSSVESIGWAGDCQRVEAGLAASMPAAVAFNENLKTFERETRADERCGRAIVDASNEDPRGESVRRRFQEVLASAKPADERCSETIQGWRSLYDGSIGAVGAAL